MHRRIRNLRPDTRACRAVGGIHVLIAAFTLLVNTLVQAQSAPTLTSVTPNYNATGVPLTSSLVFMFDQPMMDMPVILGMPPLIGNLEIVPADSELSVEGTWSEDGYTLTCAFSPDWPPNTTITWKLNPPGTFVPLYSESFVALATVSGSFTTGSGGGGGDEPPALVSSTPADESLNVALDAVVTFLFDQPMKKITTIGDAVQWVETGIDPANFVYSWSADGLILTCDYTGDFPASTVVAWTLNPESSSVKLESEATGEPLPDDTYSGYFMTGQGGGGDDCTPDGIPDYWGGYSIYKQVEYQQTSGSDPVTAPPTPYNFGVYISSPRQGPVVTSGSVTPPGGAKINLGSGPMSGFHYFSDEPASESDLNTKYPAGNYALRFTRAGEAERAIQMTLPTVTVPVPKVANYGEAQAVNYAQNFTLRWNSFAGAGENDFISLVVTETMGKVVFQAPDLCVPRELPVTATSIVIPANTFQNNKTYQGTLVFGRMFYFSTNTVPEMAGSGILSRQTQFAIKTGTGGTGTPATFTGSRLLPNGNPEMTLTGTPLSLHTIQRSGAVGNPAWTTVGAVTMNAAGTAVFEDTQTDKVFPLFYRAIAN